MWTKKSLLIGVRLSHGCLVVTQYVWSGLGNTCQTGPSVARGYLITSIRSAHIQSVLSPRPRQHIRRNRHPR